MNYYTANGNDKWTQVSNENYTYKIHATYLKNYTSLLRTLKNPSAFWKNFLPYSQNLNQLKSTDYQSNLTDSNS